MILLYVIACWAILTGVFKLAGAVRLRRMHRGAWVPALIGALSILLGPFAILLPAAGLLTLGWVIGWYAIIRGIGLLAQAIHLRVYHAFLEA